MYVVAKYSEFVLDKTHYLQLINKMKGIRTLSIPSRNPGESPLVRCDNMVIARKVTAWQLHILNI